MLDNIDLIIHFQTVKTTSVIRLKMYLNNHIITKWQLKSQNIRIDIFKK